MTEIKIGDIIKDESGSLYIVDHINEPEDELYCRPIVDGIAYLPGIVVPLSSVAETCSVVEPYEREDTEEDIAAGEEYARQQAEERAG